VKHHGERRRAVIRVPEFENRLAKAHLAVRDAARLVVMPLQLLGTETGLQELDRGSASIGSAFVR
jgi:hypothetical protein